MKGEFQLRLKYKGHGEVIEFGRSHQLELYNCHILFRITYFLQINLFDFSTTSTKLSTEVHNRGGGSTVNFPETILTSC